ncbi:MAG: transporter substrate-binding domain-containing protein [Aliarcobacter sp.]|nr:transporter substrate-binding domain-containing protein [Aliarcobacter sp.]
MKNIILILLFLPLFLSANFQDKLTIEEKNWLNNQKIITIGAMDNWAPINFVDYNNEASGIGASIVEILNQKLNSKLQITSGSWNTIYEKTKNGELNAILDITPKKEREEFFYFTEPYLQIPHVIVSKKEQKAFSSLNDLNGKIVALEENIGTIIDLQKNYPNITIKTFQNTTLSLDAVSRGLADAYIGNRAVVSYKIKEELLDNLKIDAIDSSRKPSILTLGVSKNYPILFSILQKAMGEITIQEWDNIKTRWEGKVSEDDKNINLSKEEKEWLKQNPIIKYAGDPHYMPFESFDENGNYIGIVAEHLNLIEQNLGIKFEKIKTNTWSETLEKVKESKVDMFSNYMNIKEFQDTHISVPMQLKSPIVVVGRKDKHKDFIVSLSQLKDEKIAVIKDYFYLEEIYKQYPNLNYIEVENATIALNGVSAGAFDVALCSLPVASYTISSLSLKNIEIIGKTDTYMQLGFSVKKDYEIFARILEKVLINHSSTEVYEIMQQWEKVTKKSQIDSVMLFQISIFVLLGLALLLFWNYQLKKQVAKKTHELSKLLRFFDENVIASRTDLQGNITYVSDAFCKVSGNTREFMMGKNHRIGKHPDNDPEIFKQMWETITKGKVWKGRVKNRKKDGGYYWVDSVIEQEYDFDGKVVGYISLRHDVTATVELEKLSANLENIVKERTAELFEMNQKQKAIFDTASIGIILLKNRVIQEMNNKICMIFGYEYDELINSSTRIFYEKDKDYESVQKQYEIIQSGEIATWEQLFIKKDSNSFWARVTMQAIDFTDLEKGLVATIEDITLERQALEDIKKAKLLAEESTKSKSEFLANMSHEIRTPMNAIIGMAYLTLQTNLDEQQKNYIQKIDTASKNLLGIINDILDFSKIEAGKMTIEKIDFSLDDILANLSSLFMFQIEEKGLELLFDVDINVPLALRGDSLRLNQILTNLLSNAVKFTPKGEIIISIKLLSKDEQSAEIRFDVKDTGIGISKEHMEKLFASFSQADSSTTRKYGGSGLGLAICKQIIELMGGTVGLESTPDVGSDFYFTIKFELQNVQRNLLESNNNVNNLKILVVDDNASSREILENIIKSLRFEVKALCCGKEAIIELEKANEENSPYTLVLIDWMMPEMDGIETIKRINENKGIEKTPTFIMVTAYNKDELMQKAKDAKVFGFLEKPVSPSTLYDTILKAFGKNIIINANENIRSNNFLDIKKLIQGAKILLVEDNVQNQEIATEFLQKANISTKIANNGKEAIEILENEEFDGVLMDCQMPILDGYEATKQIRKNEKFKDLPILAMTANAMQGDKEKCINSGMNDYIAKPLDFSKFYETLVKWIKPKNKVVFEEQNEEINEVDVKTMQIDGINISQALSRMAGNQKLFLNQLKRFVKSQNNFEEKILIHVKNSDLESAIREAHTLKGLCGNIGADLLFEKAKELEFHLKENGFDDKYGDLIKVIKTDLELLINNIKRAITAFLPNEINDKSALNKEKIEELFEQLEGLLKELDSDALIKANELQVEIEKLAYFNELDNFINYVNDFDFDKANEYLKLLKEKVLEKIRD